MFILNQSARYAALFLLIGFLLVGVWRPMETSEPDDSLDGSWVTVLGEADRLGLVFGENAIFTGANLSPIYSKYFNKELFPIVLIIVLFCAVVSASVIVYLLGNFRWTTIIIMVASLPFWGLSRDALFLSLPLLAGLTYLVAPPGRFTTGATAFLSALSGILVLAKFSVFPFAVFISILIDIAAVSRRHYMFSTPILFLALYIIYGFLNSFDPAAFLNYLKYSLDTAKNFGDAMSDHPDVLKLELSEIGLFIFASLLAFVSVIVTERTLVRNKRSDLQTAALVLLIVLAYLFILLKTGFVRHDFHTRTAWTGLIVMGTIYIAARGGYRTPGCMEVCLGIAMLTGVVAFHLAPSSITPDFRVSRSIENQLKAPFLQLQELVQFVSHPGEWMSHKENGKNSAFKQIQDSRKLPQLSGTVDSIPNIQTAILAAGLDLKPRFTIQEYTSYSDRLIQKNTSYYNSEHAPDFVFFSPGSISGRHPAHADGYLWPVLYSAYRPVEIMHDLVLLKRRTDRPGGQPQNIILKEQVTIGGCVELPAHDTPLFAQIDIQKSFLGALASVAFKVPHLSIEIYKQDGTSSTHRLLWTATRAGFVISPFINTATEFVEMGIENFTDFSKKVISKFCLTANKTAPFFFKPDFDVAISELDPSALVSADSLSPKLQEQLEELSWMRSIASTASGKTSSRVRIEDLGIFAHAPTDLFVNPDNTELLRIRFGLDDDAWKGYNQSDGACFEVHTLEASAPIWQRCLRPRETEQDRGVQEAVIALGQNPGKLLLRTTCGGDCRWDWTYWWKISLEKHQTIED